MDKTQKRKEIFEYVRDIPYSLNGWSMADVINTHKWNCHSKSLLLKHLFKQGYTCRSLCFLYELRSFPEEVKFIPEKQDYHYCTEIYIENQWIITDPTYDAWLLGSCFPVQSWDGINSTDFCEAPIGIIWRENESSDIFKREYGQFIRNMDQAYSLYPDQITLYTKKLESYIESYRDSLKKQ